MRKKLTLIFLFAVLFATAQVSCGEKTEKARKVLDQKKLFKNYEGLFQELLPCAANGNLLAQNYIGLMYIHGLGIAKDENQGFTYIEKAAKNGNAVAQYNLGNLYREGIGCQLNMNVAVEWYKKAVGQKNSRAAYLLGYMYLKAFGVPQDYSLAIEWFNKSDYAMAKHWLGVCYYLGYGVEQNTEKALEYLYGNTTPNSVAFLQNLKTDKLELVTSKTSGAINETDKEAKKISPELIARSREIIVADRSEIQNIKPKTILGEWTGRFIEYDWSGVTPQRILPIQVNFSKDKDGILKTNIQFEGQTFESASLLKENILVVNDFNFKLDQLYPHDFKNDKLEYAVSGFNVSQKEYNTVPYLLLDVDSFIEYWREPGTPISIILRPKNAGVPDDDALLLALASQKADFIKVYPVPFNEQLYIAFDLNEPANIELTLTNVTTAQTQKRAATNLEAGAQSFTLDTSTLPKGFYIIQIKENEKLHTKTIVKQ